MVNTDAMQVYRGMDIGTAKQPEALRRGVPHHLLDLLDITEVATVADFQVMARAVIADLRTAGKVPILVGGSALYTRAVLDQFEFPGTDPDVRRELADELDRIGPAALHARLTEIDPQAAEGILASNGRRIVRALEVIEVTGEKYSSSLPVREYELDNAHQIGVDIDRETLAGRISLRVDKMFDSGFVDEVAGLLERGLTEAVTASRAIGYSEVRRLLAGEISEAEARERTKTATRRFARRQDQWFRKDPRVTWLAWDDPDRVKKAVALVAGATQH